MKENVLKCNGSKDIWNKAKAAVGKVPTITVGPVSGNASGDSNSAGKINIKPNPDCCIATQYAVFELTNVVSAKRFDALDSKAAAGNLGREDYARGYEQIEYDGVRSNSDTFNSCKKSWGCGENALPIYAENQKFENFEDYYDAIQSSDHTNSYRSYWDNNFKNAYEMNHPSK